MANYAHHKIICGYHHTFCITDKIYVWGRNDYGTTGIRTSLYQTLPQEFNFFNKSDIIEISCGGYHTVALVKSKLDTFGKKIYAWGNNVSGQLGLKDKIDRILPTELVLCLEPMSIVVVGIIQSL